MPNDMTMTAQIPANSTKIPEATSISKYDASIVHSGKMGVNYLAFWQKK